MDRTYTDNWVEVYHTGSMVEAGRILAALRGEGIPATLHDRTSHALPAPASEPGVLAIAVPERERPKAEQVIREDLASLSQITTVE
jgi:hypothetical protein